MNTRRQPPSWIKLDRIDWLILRELQADGRMTNVELASRVGISAPPCLRRVRALEEAGFIKGYRALLDEKLLGYEVTVFAMVHLTSQAEPDLKAFEFEFVSPTRAVVVLHYQANFISEEEVSISLNGVQQGWVPPDTATAAEREIEQLLAIPLLKRSERNEVVFDNVKNPYYNDTSAAQLRQSGSVVVNSSGKQQTNGSAFDPKSFYSYTLDAAADVPALLATYAGPQANIGN